MGNRLEIYVLFSNTMRAVMKPVKFLSAEWIF